MTLPAPYTPPWKRLGEDGVALLAWLGLKIREGLRRNREGTLPVPAFWPRRWFPWFWPLVALALLLAGVAVSRPWWAGEGSSGGNAPAGGEERVAVRSEASLREWSGTAPPTPLVSPSNQERGAGQETETRQGTQEPVEASAEGDGKGLSEGGEGIGEGAESPPASPAEAEAHSDAEASAEGAESAAAADRADLLLAEWRADDPDACIDALRDDPAAATLTLQLNDHFWRQSPGKRERRAEAWLQRATELGYTHLRLEDGEQRLLGRDARVGGGMILLPALASGQMPP